MSTLEPHQAADEFHMRLGYCVTAWAEADNALFRIFMDCVAAFEQSAILYYRISSLDTRAAATEELIESVLLPKERENGGKDHPVLVRWKEIKKEISRLLNVRRRLAHQPITLKRDPSSGLKPPTFWVEIDVSRYERWRAKERNSRPLKIEDLETHHLEVMKLAGSLKAFLALLQGPDARPPQPKSQPASRKSPGSQETQPKQRKRPLRSSQG